MSKLIGRKFIFGLVAIICVSGVTAYLKFDGETYLKLVGLIVGLFLTAQTIADRTNGKTE